MIVTPVQDAPGSSLESLMSMFSEACDHLFMVVECYFEEVGELWLLWPVCDLQLECSEF